jgi:arylsulfatase A-like enzyme
MYRRAFLNTYEEVTQPEISANTYRKKKRKSYCEQIALVDSLIGRVVKCLKDNGLYENTTIIFTSDHGSVEDDYNLVNKGPWPYQSSLFVPLIVSNHPDINPGTRSDCLCGNIDVGATALDIAGDHKEFGVSRSLIGMSNGSVADREVNYSEFCDSMKLIVDKRYTFAYYPYTEQVALYDRIADPQNMINLGGKPEYTALERRLLMHIVDFMCLAKGVHIEAHDMVPVVKEGIEKKNPKFLDSFKIAFPLIDWSQYDRIEKLGLDPTINEFCRGREILSPYVYFDSERPEKK